MGKIISDANNEVALLAWALDERTDGVEPPKRLRPGAFPRAGQSRLETSRHCGLADPETLPAGSDVAPASI